MKFPRGGRWSDDGLILAAPAAGACPLGFLDELNRRNVFRMAGLYLVGAWLVVQVASTVFPLFGFGTTPARITVIVLAIGFVPALLFSWVFEWTPEGLRKDAGADRLPATAPQLGQRFDRLILLVLSVALLYFAVDKFVLSPLRHAADLREAEQMARREGRSDAFVAADDLSIAVLPFADMSSNKDQGYMSDGISEELLNLLAQVPQLRVIARTSSFSFRDKDLDIAAIAGRLHVAHVLEGSVRTSGKLIRITAKLIRAADSSELWSASFDRQLGDVFAVQDQISAAVVAQLRIQLLGAAPKARTTDPAAYTAFLQARQFSQLGTAEGLDRAVALYRQTLAIDPGYAPALVGLSTSYANQASAGLRPVEEGNRLAREAIDKALAVAPDLAAAHAHFGYLAMTYDGDLATAAKHIGRALALAPEDLGIALDAARLAQTLGRLDQAIAFDEFVVARDPVNPRAHYNLGVDYSYAKRPDDAIGHWRTALELSPNYIGARYNIGMALLAKNDKAGALAEMAQESSDPWRAIGLPMVYHSMGRKAESDAALANLVRDYGHDAAYNIAYVLAWRGEIDQAFAWLDKAVTYHDSGLTDVEVEPEFASLHRDPRWSAFLRRIGKAPEQSAAIRFDAMPPGVKR